MPRPSRGLRTAARRARPVHASSAVGCSSDPRADRLECESSWWDAGLPRTSGSRRTTGLDHHERRGLAAGQHVVADRHLFDAHPPRRVVHDALVDALVAPAGEHQVRLDAPALCDRLARTADPPVSERREVFLPNIFRPAPRPTPAPSSPSRGRHRTASRRPSDARRVSTGADRAPVGRRCLPQSPCRATIARSGSR